LLKFFIARQVRRHRKAAATEEQASSASAGAEGDGGGSSSDDNVIDAEYVDVEDEGKKYNLSANGRGARDKLNVEFASRPFVHLGASLILEMAKKDYYQFSA
jgi:hypothetical protein